MVISVWTRSYCPDCVSVLPELAVVLGVRQIPEHVTRGSAKVASVAKTIVELPYDGNAVIACFRDSSALSA